MLSAALGLTLLCAPNQIERDAYGIPKITAENKIAAYELMGRAVAQDRLWQLELSRRSARGQLAEIFGPGSIPSDSAVLAAGYTDEELDQMFRQMPASIREQWTAYAKGINDEIAARTESNSLPSGYKTNGFLPREWSVLDSAAIAIQLTRRFGQGGAGELRNYALIQYLRTRASIKDRLLDVLDDLAPNNIESAPTTVNRQDDPTLREPQIFRFTRSDSESQLAALPNTNLLEIAGALRLALQEDFVAEAELRAVPYKVGSYAIAVSPRISAARIPLLLSAPQMGHTNPSVIHEVAFDAPGLQVAGMDVPGIPGVIIGNSPTAAWGFTSGVADLEDIFVSTLNPNGTYQHQSKPESLQSVKFTIKVKGEPDRDLIQLRTVHGPVLLKSDSSKAVYSLRSAYWKRELAAMVAMDRLPTAKDPSDFTSIAQIAPVSFNLFFATTAGDIGYRYCGAMPIRARGVDPRMPTPDEERFQWQGFVSSSDMPRLDNPRSGLIYNWNNKPVSWWPNGDTPVWTRFFRSVEIGKALPSQSVSAFDLERAAWTIARRETETEQALMPMIRQAIALMPKSEPNRELLDQLAGFDGWNVDGSISASLYAAVVDELRTRLFAKSLGNFTSDALFRQVLQAGMIMDALEQKTKIAYSTDDPMQTMTEAIRAVVARPVRPFRPGSIAIPNGSPIPYINRGTYIQITELGAKPRARSVASPGVSEEGEHAFDQVNLARSWVFKPMWQWD